MRRQFNTREDKRSMPKTMVDIIMGILINNTLIIIS